MKYITNDDTIIFDPSFDEELDPELLTKYKRIIFTNYILDHKLFDAYINNKFKGLKVDVSKFNHPVNELPHSITHLTFGFSFNLSVDNLVHGITHLTFGKHFNQLVDNLPSSITHLTFDFDFNQSLNNLPPDLEFITLSIKYDLQILNIPPRLQVINCFNKYKYINDLNNLTSLTGLKVIIF